MVQLRPLDPRDPDIDPPESPPENPRPPRTDPPISNFHAYGNSRPDVDWNTCGQAAIASMLDHLGRDPFGLPRVRRGIDGRMHWDDGAVIDALINAGFGPDVAFGFGTTGGRIRDALFAYGCNQAYEEHSGLFSAGWQGLWERLKVFLRDLKTPVQCLWTLEHWAAPIIQRTGPLPTGLRRLKKYIWQLAPGDPLLTGRPFCTPGTARFYRWASIIAQCGTQDNGSDAE